MANFLKDNEDLRYYLEKGIDWATLVSVTERRFGPGGFADPDEAKQFYDDSLELLGELCAEQVAPHALQIDRESVELENGEVIFPPRLASIFETIRGLELHGMCLPRELGGQNAPMFLYYIGTELFARADVSVMAHHGFHGGVALAMLLFSVREGSTRFDPDSGDILETRFAAEIEEIRRGDASGCMDITEPDAGSDMARLKTRGEQDADGRWYVTGQKIFITSGQGKYHFVIARTEQAGDDDDDPMAGLGGLSMFLVPAYETRPDGSRRRAHVVVDRIEEKMGHHGSATAALSFERAPAQLIGKRGEGFKYMLMLMNNARISVGFECIGLCEAAHRLAVAYAAERRSMGKTLDKHEMIADYLDEMQTDIQALRAMAMHAGFHEEVAQKLELELLRSTELPDLDKKRREREISRHRTISRRATPLLKYLGAERAVEISRRALQIHGGNGYMREFGAEKLVRDAVVMPIYEGTSQIQALMAMKDKLGAIMKSPQGFVKKLAQTRWRALSSRDANERRVARIQLLSLSAQQHLIAKTAGAKFREISGKPLSEWPNALLSSWDPKRDFAHALLHAERLTRLLADELVSELLLEQARRHPERQELFERWLERAEPRCRFLYDEITSTGARLLAKLEEPTSDPARAAS
jgi:3-(methylthio)propanoyl-CoA dehydrogenase